jgi:hypothetical protein
MDFLRLLIESPWFLKLILRFSPHFSKMLENSSSSTTFTSSLPHKTFSLKKIFPSIKINEVSPLSHPLTPLPDIYRSLPDLPLPVPDLPLPIPDLPPLISDSSTLPPLISDSSTLPSLPEIPGLPPLPELPHKLPVPTPKKFFLSNFFKRREGLISSSSKYSFPWLKRNDHFVGQILILTIWECFKLCLNCHSFPNSSSFFFFSDFRPLHILRDFFVNLDYYFPSGCDDEINSLSTESTPNILFRVGVANECFLLFTLIVENIEEIMYLQRKYEEDIKIFFLSFVKENDNLKFKDENYNGAIYSSLIMELIFCCMWILKV